MKKYVFLIIKLVFFQILTAQKIFHEGIVELNSGEKIEALILQDSFKNKTFFGMNFFENNIGI